MQLAAVKPNAGTATMPSIRRPPVPRPAPICSEGDRDPPDRAWPPSPRPQGRHRRERPGRRRWRRLCSSPGSRDSLPPHQPSSFAPPPPPEPRPASARGEDPAAAVTGLARALPGGASGSGEEEGGEIEGALGPAARSPPEPPGLGDARVRQKYIPSIQFAGSGALLGPYF